MLFCFCNYVSLVLFQNKVKKPRSYRVGEIKQTTNNEIGKKKQIVTNIWKEKGDLNIKPIKNSGK